MTNEKPLTPITAYKFCPRCGGNFKHVGDNALKCDTCSYTFFVNASPASGAIILDDQKRVLLVRRKFEPYKDTWQIPGGFMTPGETVEEAVVREIKEELDITIRATGIVHTLPMIYPYRGVALPLLCIYSSAVITGGIPTPHDDVAEVKFFDKASIEKLSMTTEAQREMLVNYPH